MPASVSTFNAVAVALEGIDPEDEDAIGAFYVDVYPRYSPRVRSVIADWMSSLCVDATREDLDSLLSALKAEGNYLAKSAVNPFYAEAEPSRAGASHSDYKATAH